MKLFSRYLLSLIFVMTIFSGLTGAETSNSMTEAQRKSEPAVDSLLYNEYRGTVIDKDTKAPLIFAAICVKGTSIATISNSEGNFVLKIDKKMPYSSIAISHIGYKNLEVPIHSLKEKKNILKLESVTVSLDEVNIFPHDPLNLVQGMLKRIPQNYSPNPNMMEGFYREIIKRNRKYVAISEAVVNIHKAGYKQYRNDQVQIFKGRKKENVKKVDTLLFKLQGGPSTALLMDVIKNPSTLFTDELEKNYDFSLKSITKVSDRLHYVIEFKQKPEVTVPLYYGMLYVDTENLALTSAHFSLNLDDQDETSKLFITKKPAGVKVSTTVANYLVNYTFQEGKWFFNYARFEVNFKCNWKRKLFNTNFSAMSEMAITDRDEENVVRFKPRKKFKTKDIMVEMVSKFADKNFWGAHNTIEPDKSIETAIRKLKKNK